MKKMGKFLYGIMFSFFVMMLCSCGVKNKGASVSLSVDIQESLQKNDFVFSRSIVDEELLLEVCLFDVDDNYKEYKVKTVSMVDGKAKVSFDKIPEGFNGVIEAKILYEEITLYEGKSDAFTVRPGKNVINLQLNKVKIDEKSKIAGIAKFENAAEHLGINVTLVSTDGLMTTDASAARGIATNARVVKDFVTTDKDGNYLFENVAAGVYTIYASSNSSTEKAILTNVVVSEEGGTITPSVLKLTATGTIKGSVTIDGKAENTYGADILVLGTSYSASTDENGAFEISGVPAKEGYVLCFRKDGYTTIVQRDVVVNADSATDIGSKNISSAEWKEYAFTWLGAYDEAPVVAQKNQAYFNKTDGCSYIYTGTSWEMLTAAGKDGVNGQDGAPGEKGEKGDAGEKGEKGDPGEKGEAAEGGDKYNGILDLKNFIPEKVTIKDTRTYNCYEVITKLPYEKQLPNVGDKVTLELEFISSKDINNFTIYFRDHSEASAYLTLISGEDYGVIEKVTAGETIKFSKTFDFIEKPISNVSLNMYYLMTDTDYETDLQILKSNIYVTSSSGIPNCKGADLIPSQISCEVIEEGIKFTGNLLSNVQDSISTCEIHIKDVDNNITMVRNYSIASTTWQYWEIIYPLVEKDKKYNFEVTVFDQSSKLYIKEFSVQAIGGLGEYKVENAEELEVTLSEDKKIISRTSQKFTNNLNVPILDYGTKYYIYSNQDTSSYIWDGIWCDERIIWSSSTSNEYDLDTVWRYDSIYEVLRGRKLGVGVETIIKVAGYTYNGTASFKLNDYKETFFDWDDEEPNKYFVVYRNPETGEYFTDVPGTSLYYTAKGFDEEGNVVFVDKNTEGATPVYGKLINYCDKIYEPVYAPKFDHYKFTGYWKILVGEYSDEFWPTFPFNSVEYLQCCGECIPLVFEPEVNANTYVVTIQDESGTELCKINTNNLTFKISGSDVLLRQGYGLSYLSGSDGKQYNVNQTYECKEDLILTAHYELLRSTFNVGDILFSDGTYIEAENAEYGIPESLKSKAMAVITAQAFDGRYLGVGLKSENLQWTAHGALGYYMDFEGIKVNVTGGYWDGDSYSDYSFEGDLDGSDNWEYIHSVDSSSSDHYPIFNFANNYASYADLLDTEYDIGWFIPSVAELYDVYTNKTIIQTSMNVVGVVDISYGLYWSSSQSSTIEFYADGLDFSDGCVWNTNKDVAKNVLVLRAFNPEDFTSYDYGTPSITSVEIPTVGEGYSGEIPVTIKGENFVGPNFTLDSITCTGVELYNITKESDSKITATVYCDGAVGETEFTITYGSSSVTGSLKVVSAANCYSVGDIVLSDGTKVSVTEVETYEFDEATKPIGVVAIANYNGGTAKILGLERSPDTLQWIAYGALGYYMDFEGIKAEFVEGYGFYGDLDGSDNWGYICSVDPNAEFETSYYYPAFDFANNYTSYAELSDTEYYTGWFIPSVAELYEVYTNKSLIHTSMSVVSGFDITSGQYWSSSQSSYSYELAYGINFYDLDVGGISKNSYNYVLVLLELYAE